MTNPVKAVSSVSDFKKTSQRGVEFTLPSGHVCLVKRPGITELIAEGLFPDSLMGMVGGFIDKGQGKKTPQDRKKTAAQEAKDQDKQMEQAMSEIANDPAKLRDMLLTIDKAAVYCIVQPPVLYNRYPIDHEDPALRGHIIPEDDRDESLLYIDEVDEDDKMAVFNFAVGGDEEEQASLGKFPDAG